MTKLCVYEHLFIFFIMCIQYFLHTTFKYLLVVYIIINDNLKQIISQEGKFTNNIFGIIFFIHILFYKKKNSIEHLLYSIYLLYIQIFVDIKYTYIYKVSPEC